MVHAVPQSCGDFQAPTKLFTLAEANEMLPLVRRITADLIRLQRSFEAQHAQRQGLEAIVQPSDRPEFVEEVQAMHRALADEQVQIERYLNELTSLGLQPHFPLDGSLDFPAEHEFPARHERRLVHLCWHPGDPSVAHWHEVGQGAGHRRRLGKGERSDASCG